MCICAYFYYRELCCPIIGWLCPVAFQHGVVHRLSTGCGYVVDNLVDILWVLSVDNLWETKFIGVSWLVGMSGPDRILGPEMCLNSPFMGDRGGRHKCDAYHINKLKFF